MRLQPERRRQRARPGVSSKLLHEPDCRERASGRRARPAAGLVAQLTRRSSTGADGPHRGLGWPRRAVRRRTAYAAHRAR